MAPDKSDQPGVLGNLPRSRPGQRSQKRAGPERAAATGGAKPATRSRAAASKRKPAPARKPASNARKRAAAAPPPERPAPQPAAGAPDPLTFAFRAAGKVAEVGLKTAGGLLRRLPGR